MASATQKKTLHLFDVIDQTKPGYATSFFTESDWIAKSELPVDSKSQKLCHLSAKFDALYVVDDTKKVPTHYKFVITADKKLEISQNRVELMGLRFRE